MITKAQEQGLTIDPAVLPTFAMLSEDDAMDNVRETSPDGAPQHLRPVENDAHLANSVGVRVKYILDYRPANLNYDDDGLADGYKLVEVVKGVSL